MDLRKVTAAELAELICMKVEAFRREDARFSAVLAGAWSSEGNVYPADTHRLDIELEIEGEVVTGILQCWGEDCYTGVASIQGTRYKGKMLISVTNIVRDAKLVEFGDAILALIEGHANTPTQIRWQLKSGLEQFLPKETTLYRASPK